MCQAYEGERRYMVVTELQDILEAWEKHKSGEHPLTADELRELAIRKLMLEEE